MNEEAQLLYRLWENVQDFIPNAEKFEVAKSIIRTLLEFGNDIHLLYDAEGNCSYLDRALEAIEGEEDDEREIDDRHDDY